MSRADSPIRVLALIYPIERHVGHWAGSSRLLEVRRIIMDGPSGRKDIEAAFDGFDPEVVAVCGKAAIEYLDLLDELGRGRPALRTVPRVFRMQNSSLVQRSEAAVESKAACRDLSLWFKLACDPRWAWVFVQTLNDVDVIRKHLSPLPVSACPYGYDTAVFNPDLPEIERDIDVGCFMNLRDDPGRRGLVREAEAICRRRGWAFRFEEGIYWHGYANLIRRSKTALHRSIYREVPFRMYETTVFGTVFITDPLGAQVETLFQEGREYVTYKPDLSDLEAVLERVLTNDPLRRTIGNSGRARARGYAWETIADRYITPALSSLLGRIPNADSTQGARR